MPPIGLEKRTHLTREPSERHHGPSTSNVLLRLIAHEAWVNSVSLTISGFGWNIVLRPFSDALFSRPRYRLRLGVRTAWSF